MILSYGANLGPDGIFGKDRLSMILYANAALQASIAGMQKVLNHLKAHGSLDGVSVQLASFEERQRLVCKPRFDALEKKYS